jgi:hypothetical protein
MSQKMCDDFSAVEMILRCFMRGYPCLLQWGHDFSAVEIKGKDAALAEKDVASMGPRLFSRGNSGLDKEWRPDRGASMGPRLFSRGNGGHFSPAIDIENLAVFERFLNSYRVFYKVRLSSREFSQIRGVSSAPRSSRNHLTSRKALSLLLSFAQNAGISARWGKEYLCCKK